MPKMYSFLISVSDFRSSPYTKLKAKSSLRYLPVKLKNEES